MTMHPALALPPRRSSLERLTRWVDARPRLVMLGRVAALVLGTLLTVVAWAALLGLAGLVMSVMVFGLVWTMFLVPLGVTGAAAGEEGAAQLAASFAFIAEVCAIAGALVGAVRAGRLWESGDDPRPRHEAARSVVEQALVATSYGGMITRMSVGVLAGGDLTYATEVHIGGRTARQAREAQLAVLLADSSMERGTEPFATLRNERRREALRTRIFAIADDLVLDAVLSGDGHRSRAATIAEAHRRGRAAIEAMPESRRQEIERELLRAGRIRGVRAHALLGLAGTAESVTIPDDRVSV